MAGLKAALFGRFRLERDNQQLAEIEASKARELLCYLLLNREKPQPREHLAELLWEDQSPAKSKKYLRQTIWKLKVDLTDAPPSDLLVESEWVQLNPAADWWLDVAEFEHDCACLKNKRAADLSDDEFLSLQTADELYKGELLEGWYQDWCLLERERYQTMYLRLLNKLVQYCVLHQQLEAGLAFGGKLLRYDRAYEQAHRQMMRLYFMSGDRTQALRQYRRCVEALQEELGIDPSERTIRLYERIKAGAWPEIPFETSSIKNAVEQQTHLPGL